MLASTIRSAVNVKRYVGPESRATHCADQTSGRRRMKTIYFFKEFRMEESKE